MQESNQIITKAHHAGLPKVTMAGTSIAPELLLR